jgi:hypothetical protein
MSILTKYLTEKEFVAELKKRTGKGSVRAVREWRRKRRVAFARGPGNEIFLPENALETVLDAALQKPVRPRHTT